MNSSVPGYDGVIRDKFFEYDVKVWECLCAMEADVGLERTDKRTRLEELPRKGRFPCAWDRCVTSGQKQVGYLRHQPPSPGWIGGRKILPYSRQQEIGLSEDI